MIFFLKNMLIVDQIFRWKMNSDQIKNKNMNRQINIQLQWAIYLWSLLKINPRLLTHQKHLMAPKTHTDKQAKRKSKAAAKADEANNKLAK